MDNMPLNQQIYEELLQMILTNKLTYGTFYSETKIAQDFNVSRTPMRSALDRLSQEGYIDIIPSKGFCLHKVSKEDIIEIYQIRSAVEGFCAHNIAENCTNHIQLFEELNILLNRQKDILDNSGTIEDFFTFDRQFHEKIVNALDNDVFNKLFKQYIFSTKMLALSSLKHKGRVKQTFQEHTEILLGMESGDANRALSATLKHMENPKYINLKDYSNE